MRNKFLKIFPNLIFSGLATSIAPSSFCYLTSCNSLNAIQFANYESYMSQDLIDDLQSNLGYPIQFPYYTVAEMIPAKFEKYYDLAVPCGYEIMALLSKGWLEKIDWAKFDVKSMDGTTIKTADDALENLYVNEKDGYNGLAKMNLQFTNYFNNKLDRSSPLIQNLEKDGTFEWKGVKQFNILNYGVPYFAQSYMFGYKGEEEITFYQYKTDTKVDGNPSWADIFWTVSPSNPNQPEIFKNNKIAMVDDARSYYDICRIVESKVNNEPEVTNAPLEGKDDTKERMLQTMSVVADLFSCRTGKNFLLNTDSQIVSKTFADRKCGINGIMSWSGDTIYAAQGAEEFDAFTSENLHIVKPSSASLDEIEFMVINKKNQNNKVKRDAIYKAVKQIGLDGCDKSPEEIVEYNDELDRYTYWSMLNWDEILYTPLLKNIYQAVTNTDKLSTYWTDKMNDEGYSEDTVKNLFIKIIDGDIPSNSKHLFGGVISTLQNSNIHWDWSEIRDKL